MRMDKAKKHFKQEKLGRQKYKPMAKPHMLLCFLLCLHLYQTPPDG